MTRYEKPLGAEELAAGAGFERARLCDRLETMWQGLQTDIEEQRHGSERGVDPRLQQLQLAVVKIQAQLLKLTGPMLPEPPPEVDPNKKLVDAAALAAARMEEVVDRLAADAAADTEGPAEPKLPPDTGWIET